MLRRRYLRPLLILAGICIGTGLAAAAIPPAGAAITNTATATYVDASNQVVHVTSNTVATTVSALEALTLTSNQTIQPAAGAAFALSHALMNTGNVVTSYGLNATLTGGNGFPPVGLTVVQDLNGNGRADPGEPVIAPGGTVTCAPGQAVNLLITGTIPASAQPGQSAQVTLTAVSQQQHATASNTDQMTITSPIAILSDVVSSITVSTTPGSPVALVATVSNSASVPAYPVPVTVNGTAGSLFINLLAVPANTTYSAAATSTPGAQTLYHVTGSPVGSFLTTAPAGAGIDAVAFALPMLPPQGSLAGQLTVTVNANASLSFLASAVASWNQLSAAGLTQTPSNTLTIVLPLQAPTIAYYTSNTYAQKSRLGIPGSPLYVQVSAAACNTQPSEIQSVPVTIVSQLTGDTEVFTATEIAPNTGLFRIQPSAPTANAATHPVASGNGVLEMLTNDTVTASISRCGSVSVTATTALLIDPSGVVYDSHTNSPLTGVTVTLIDVTGAGNGGNAGGAARVYQPDGSTAAPSTVVTGADGRYSFPLVAPGTYRITITAPRSYLFPSRIAAARQPAGRVIDAQGSYGGAFVVGGGSEVPMHFDLPLDPVAGTAALLVQKSADRVTAEIGDSIGYSVQINNVSGGTLPDAVVVDELPAGFTYLAGSVRLNGARVADPAGGGGPTLHFALGPLIAGAQPTLTYRVRVNPGAQGGNGVNTAQAISGALASNRASAGVQIVGGVFDSKAYLVGKVFADCNANGVQDNNESGIPGVRIYLEDGTYAVTDEAGKYSLYGLIPRMHVARLDTTTLPARARLEVLDHRNAMDAGTAFVDMIAGELHKTNFAVTGCTGDLDAQIKARREALRRPNEVQQAGALLWSQSPAQVGLDSRSLPSAGIIRLPGAADTPSGLPATPQAPPLVSGMPGITPFAATVTPLGAVGDVGGPYAPQAQGLPLPLQVSTETLIAEESARQDAAAIEQDPFRLSDTRIAAEAASAASLETLLPRLDRSVGFINLRDQQQLSVGQSSVQVKGPIGSRLVLTVNGTPVAETQVGKKATLERAQLLAWEYVGVNLRAGRNTLAVRALDEFGNDRGGAEISVIAPGDLARIVIEAPEEAIADGATAVPVNVFLRDAQGLPIVARTLVTLQSSLGRWQVPASSGAQAVSAGPGQVLITGGAAKLLLLPPAQPGRAELGAASGAVKAVQSINFTPNLRPMIAAGLVSGTLNLRNLSAASLQPVQSSDAFEREIANVSRSFNGGKDDIAARSALFLKGRVLGSSLLTLAYDSDKPSDTTLFRDIQPDQFYPVYGDSSARGYDAQSTGRLYVMIQNGTNYALFGDYTTQSDNPARQLTQYSRALNGVKEHWQLGRATMDGFASETSTSQSIVEFRANGTSGPFQLDLNGVANSQQVDIITRDRNQPGVIVSDTPLTPFTDYEIEPYTGLLLLKSPVPSVDPGFNPVYIRVNYAIERGGPRHWVEGADVRLSVADGLTLGATALHDADPSNELTLEGVSAIEKFDAHTIGVVEIARSVTDVQGDGTAERIDLQRSGGPLEAHLYGTHTDAGFYNPNSLQSAGESQYGLKGAYRLDEKDRIVAEAINTSNKVTGARQTGGEVKLERALPRNAKVEVGVRHSSQNAQSALSAPTLPGLASAAADAPQPQSVPVSASPEAGYTSARIKLTTPVPAVRGAEVYGLTEQAIDGSGGKEIGLGGTYAVTATTRLYAEHDFINSLNGPYTLNPSISQYSTVAGMTTTLSDSTQLFDEYRVGEGIDGRSSEAAVGMRRLWKLTDGLGLRAGLQRITPLSGVVTDTSSAITLGADYTNHSDWKGSAQAQWQASLSSHSWLFTAGAAHKLDEDWTLLERALYSDQRDVSDGNARRLIRAQSGVAYRPVRSDIWNALGQVEFKRDADSTLGPGLALNEQAWIGAGNLNVQPLAGWDISARYAVKEALDWGSGDGAVHSLTQLAGARTTRDLARRWDVGAQAYALWGNGTEQHALGADVGYLIWKNLWLSVGYNAVGFSAPDLAGESYTQQGVYLHLNFKFDETLLQGIPLNPRSAVSRAGGGRTP